ncbi:FAD-binding oxidoreductase [Nesterenkonia xinjiangensis]|uniref:FAD/FMN-containing dehydrogenase n=1 Tax=Nesterenkonia xinjiangensis TaxID=225327 RepID=A0A7Z0GIN4_9MICC|nr:FAD-binding oxidoreductase [Nesterenkonia xinjiangensis]NYJ76712.1 FAD/FMN-containing dehydrogenase [Nesterenkonia xinjiangensis]
MTIHSFVRDVEHLAASCRGVVRLPTDGTEYLEACSGWNVAWTQRPAVLVGATSEGDVVHAVRYAADHDLTVAVQNTGHSVTVPADERTLLIVTGGLDQVSVDPQTQTATVGGGTTWNPVLADAQRQGLAPLLGSAPHVGTVGYSLGGGFGWLARKHGLAVDAVRSMRVVLADGRIVTTSPAEEPELFWAMCGTAGSGLGVVVEMTTALVPVEEVYAGNLFYPLDAAGEVFDRYLDWSGQAPAELTSAFNITAFPALDIVPPPLQGQTFVIVRGCWAGAPGSDADAGPRQLDTWRAWKPPLMDTWTSIPFARAAEISMDPVDPLPAASSGRWLSRLDRIVLDAMVEAVCGGEGPSPILFAEARHAGGAIRRDNPEVSFGARDGDRMLELVGLITDPVADTDLEHRIATIWRRLKELLAPLPGYLNFVEGHERVQASRHAFDADTLDRLRAAKRRFDPHDLFRHGIPLAGPG